MKCFFCDRNEAVGKMTNDVNVEKDACLEHLLAGMVVGWTLDDAGLDAVEKYIKEAQSGREPTEPR